MNDFGTWLKTTRKSRGMAQRELASITGMRPCTICGYEKGRFYPSIYAVEQLVDALGYELVIRERI